MAQVLSPSGVPTGHLFGNTIGAVVLGWGISSLIFGMFCIQVWTYYQRYPNDHWSYKVLVLALWALEALHQIFVGHIVWFYLVENFGSSLVFLKPPVWTLSAQTLLGSLIGTIVKICFGMRVWKFSRGNYLVTGLIISMAVAQFATAIVYTLRTFHLTVAQADQIKGSQTIGSVALSLGMVTDVFTAASLSYFLHKMRTGFKSVFSAAVLASYNLMPLNLIYIALYFVLSKLFANSCVGTLNTRRFIQGRGTDREEPTIPTFLMVANTLPAPLERTLEKRNAPQYAQGW
ncbi:hypothetical protein EDB92DRAFT_1817259 [Lactarius akahatsu]|uniref:DUF6534 domain-containing protein n=1 Tax=Lactarius akahatsu TaxID=416441 RepID=A0AAD4LHY6_9AGAM|nr:hypothetical protein EDB92DRAFT_1817259 [Lactarius akahatsu]